jgi:hypothetical protein
VDIVVTAESGGNDVLDEAFERPALPAEAKAELTRLRSLSERAQTGDTLARKELREALQKTSPQLITEVTDFTRQAQRMVATTISSGDRLMEEALPLRLAAMQHELSGENAGALERLLAGRIVSLWFLLETLDALASAQLRRSEGVKRASPAFLKFVFRWQESLNRRFLSSVRELVRVQGLQSNTPSALVSNTQINVLGLTQEPSERWDS